MTAWGNGKYANAFRRLEPGYTCLWGQLCTPVPLHSEVRQYLRPALGQHGCTAIETAAACGYANSRCG